MIKRRNSTQVDPQRKNIDFVASELFKLNLEFVEKAVACLVSRERGCGGTSWYSSSIHYVDVDAKIYFAFCSSIHSTEAGNLKSSSFSSISWSMDRASSDFQSHPNGHRKDGVSRACSWQDSALTSMSTREVGNDLMIFFHVFFGNVSSCCTGQ